ncbi:MAG: hypothetical protein FD149_1772 [Rhodospirillaceae bacterium]|nr:MAG: hypothetical protein FD149_1772 [Rhodospirillaceae bacterium]
MEQGRIFLFNIVDGDEIAKLAIGSVDQKIVVGKHELHLDDGRGDFVLVQVLIDENDVRIVEKKELSLHGAHQGFERAGRHGDALGRAVHRRQSR